MSTRKQKETPKETPEQKEQREKAEKAAEELVQQEEAERKKQEAKDAKSKKAAAEIRRRPVRPQLNNVKLKSKRLKVSRLLLRNEESRQLSQIMYLGTSRHLTMMISLGRSINIDHISRLQKPWYMKKKKVGSSIMTSNQQIIWMFVEPGHYSILVRPHQCQNQ